MSPTDIYAVAEWAVDCKGGGSNRAQFLGCDRRACAFGVGLGGLSLQVESERSMRVLMIAWAWGRSMRINVLTTNQAPGQHPPNNEEVYTFCAFKQSHRCYQRLQQLADSQRGMIR